MLTAGQKRTLDFIERYVSENGVAPLVSEIAKGTGRASKCGPHRDLVALEERGLIRRMPYLHRAIEIVRKAPAGKQPPFPGAIPIYDSRTHEIRGWLA